MRWILFLGFLMSANVGFSLAGASIDARFKRDVIDSNKEDMDKLSRLDKKLSFMSNLGSYQKVAGQRRSDEKSTFKPQEAMPAMVTVASPVAPQARMADDSVPIRITTTTAKTAVTPTKPYSEPGKDTLRECLHPKDVNCIKDGKVANLTVGIVHRYKGNHVNLHHIVYLP
jgi:hypothetical protein